MLRRTAGAADLSERQAEVMERLIAAVAEEAEERLVRRDLGTTIAETAGAGAGNGLHAFLGEGRRC